MRSELAVSPWVETKPKAELKGRCRLAGSCFGVADDPVARLTKSGTLENRNALLGWLDTSKRRTRTCVLSATGDVIGEAEVETTPKAIVAFLRGDRRRYALVGMEAGSMAPWLYAGLTRAGLPALCIDTWHAHGALKTSATRQTEPTPGASRSSCAQGALGLSTLTARATH